LVFFRFFDAVNVIKGLKEQTVIILRYHLRLEDSHPLIATSFWLNVGVLEYLRCLCDSLEDKEVEVVPIYLDLTLQVKTY
jgi:hypothetical protein